MKCDPLQRWRYDIHSKVVATQLRAIVITFLLSDPSVVTCNHAVVSVAGAGRAQAGRSLARRRDHVVGVEKKKDDYKTRLDWLRRIHSTQNRARDETRGGELSQSA